MELKETPLRTYLISVDACKDAIEWAGEKTLSEIWATCDRGDWMLWLMKKANMCDLRTLTLAKARCVELVKHLMRSQRSLDALQATFDFANGKVSAQELSLTACSADVYALSAANTAADAAYTSAYDADADAVAAYYAARFETLAKCADICRGVLPNPSINN